jgi:carboxypeptidase A4
MTWDAYHRLANIYTYMDYLARTYPNLCSLKEIGKSHEGRAIKVLKISNSNEKKRRSTNKAVWVDAGIHA